MTMRMKYRFRQVLPRSTPVAPAMVEPSPTDYHARHVCRALDRVGDGARAREHYASALEPGAGTTRSCESSIRVLLHLIGDRPPCGGCSPAPAAAAEAVPITQKFAGWCVGPRVHRLRKRRWPTARRLTHDPSQRNIITASPSACTALGRKSRPKSFARTHASIVRRDLQSHGISSPARDMRRPRSQVEARPPWHRRASKAARRGRSGGRLVPPGLLASLNSARDQDPSRGSMLTCGIVERPPNLAGQIGQCHTRAWRPHRASKGDPAPGRFA